MYLTIRDDIADQIIEHGLSKTESKLFFYLLKLDRFGDRPVKLKVAQILLATGIGKTAYHAAVAKFEQLGWFDFRHSEVEVSNQCSQSSESRTESSEKRTVFPESRTGIPEKRTAKANKNSGKADNRAPKAATGKGFGTPHTIQTYSDFIQSLSDSERENFLEFGLRQAQALKDPPKLPRKWVEKHFEEIAEQWRRSQLSPPSAANSASSEGRPLHHLIESALKSGLVRLDPYFPEGLYDCGGRWWKHADWISSRGNKTEAL